MDGTVLINNSFSYSAILGVCSIFTILSELYNIVIKLKTTKLSCVVDLLPHKTNVF